MKFIKKVIKPENQYYFLCIPHLVVFIMAIFMAKCIRRGNTKLLLKVCLLFVFVFSILGVVLPQLIVSYWGFPGFFDSPAFAYYYNFVMILWGIFLIKKQQMV